MEKNKDHLLCHPCVMNGKYRYGLNTRSKVGVCCGCGANASDVPEGFIYVFTTCTKVNGEIPECNGWHTIIPPKAATG